MLHAACAILDRHGTRVLAASLPIGLVWQDLAAVLRPAVTPIAVSAMLLTVARMDWAPIGAQLRRPGRVAAVLAWVLVGAPVLVFAVSAPLLPAGSPLLSGLMLKPTAPPIFSAPAYALIVGIDPVPAVIAGVLGNALAPFTAPAVLAGLGLDAVRVDEGSLLLRLLAIVAVALAGAWAVKRVMGAQRIARQGTVLGALVVLLISAFGIGLMDGVMGHLMVEPGLVAGYVAAAFAINIGLQAAGALPLWRRDRGQALVMALVSGNRNMSMMTAAVIDVAGPDVVLFLVCTQFPLYYMPLVMRPVFRRLGWT